MPSPQVCSKFESPGSPQFWNQEPPRKQQLRLPAWLVPHLGHVVGARVVDTAVVVTDSMCMGMGAETKKQTTNGNQQNIVKQQRERKRERNRVSVRVKV